MYVKFRSLGPSVSLKYHFGILSLTYSQKEVWLSDTKVLGLKSILVGLYALKSQFYLA